MAEENSAFEACKDFVKDRLKSPSSAEFPDYFDQDSEVLVSDDGAGTYTINSHVDAENAFGAQLQAGFTCVVSDKGDTWRLVSVDIEGI